MATTCNERGCDKEWDEDPILQIACPNSSCSADVGQVCRRPSGHQVWYSWGRFHKERDLKALEEGKYGECPLGKCPETLGDVDPEYRGDYGRPKKTNPTTPSTQSSLGDW